MNDEQKNEWLEEHGADSNCTCRAIYSRGSMSLTTKEGKWYWHNWAGLMLSPYFSTRKEAEDWRARFNETD